MTDLVLLEISLSIFLFVVIGLLLLLGLIKENRGNY